ncbi:MAG TPA: ATP-binding protein, partial [bacterium]|nr:ATP-binding protein [bacterium]
NIAHEIRNPLGSIELFASLVRKGMAEGDERMTLMHHISSAITSMNHIISNVLEYSKPRSVSLQPMDLHALLRELDGFFRFMAGQNGVELVLALQAPQGQIRGDRELLKQALHNLLLNAVQAMPEGGTLTLSTRALSVTGPDVLSRFGQAAHGHSALEVVQVQVQDTGVGMSPEMRGRIFDPFFTTRSRGTGLGLAIVHTIVEAHHGTIDVESQLNRGTTFALMFPTLPP